MRLTFSGRLFFFLGENRFFSWLSQWFLNGINYSLSDCAPRTGQFWSIAYVDLFFAAFQGFRLFAASIFVGQDRSP